MLMQSENVIRYYLWSAFLLYGLWSIYMAFVMQATVTTGLISPGYEISEADAKGVSQMAEDIRQSIKELAFGALLLAVGLSYVVPQYRNEYSELLAWVNTSKISTVVRTAVSITSVMIFFMAPFFAITLYLPDIVIPGYVLTGEDSDRINSSLTFLDVLPYLAIVIGVLLESLREKRTKRRNEGSCRGA